MKPSKVQKKIEQIHSRMERGYDIGPKEIRFLFGLVEDAEVRMAEKAGEVRELQERLDAVKDDLLWALSREGWIKKVRIGRLAVCWLTKESDRDEEALPIQPLRGDSPASESGHEQGGGNLDAAPHRTGAAQAVGLPGGARK